ncbi:hypothetical protein LOD99_370 [Oopsacas minuta]|uniref:E3 ubiquitin-protein ligase n=1 Tax=Oopsacas minuta TaxID=111878 RepID=A0AAV7K965_9METZ|nr:hypothetical protein LOD99_370 [Oopsacas minuta]
MSGIDTGILIEWINVFGQDSERELQLTGLEQLCQMLSMFDNIDKCLENFPPKTFIPVLCNIFLDDTAPEVILEPATRALYFFLDISLDCGKKITSVSGTITKFINIIEFANTFVKESLDLGEQCVKILDLLSRGDSKSVFDAGGLPCVLKLTTLGTALHKDALYSSISAAIHLCPRVDPDYQHLPFVCLRITQLMESDDKKIFDGCLKCFTILIKKFVSKKADLTPLVEHGLLERLLEKFDQNTKITKSKVHASPGSVSYSGVVVGECVVTILPVFGLLCRGSPSITETLLGSKLPEKLKITLQADERYVVEGLRLIEVLEILALEGREALAKSHFSSTAILSDMFTRGENPDSPIRHIVDVLKNQDYAALVTAVEKGFDVNYINDIGQSLLNWATAVGSEKQVRYLLNQGADPCLGQKFSSLHLSVMTKKPNLVKVLLKYGANPEQRAEDGSTPLEKALLLAGDGSKEGKMLVEILENAGMYLG